MPKINLNKNQQTKNTGLKVTGKTGILLKAKHKQH